MSPLGGLASGGRVVVYPHPRSMIPYQTIYHRLSPFDVLAALLVVTFLLAVAPSTLPGEDKLPMRRTLDLMAFTPPTASDFGAAHYMARTGVRS